MNKQCPHCGVSNPPDPPSCEVDDCNREAELCSCGNAHCPDHPHIGESWQEEGTRTPGACPLCLPWRQRKGKGSIVDYQKLYEKHAKNDKYRAYLIFVNSALAVVGGVILLKQLRDEQKA